MTRTYLIAVQDQDRLRRALEARGFRCWVGFNCIVVDWSHA